MATLRRRRSEGAAETSPAEESQATLDFGATEAPVTEGGAEPAPEAPADPTTEEVVTTDEAPFDPEKAYAELKDMYDALKGEVEALKEQLGKLLEVPAEDDAFKAAKKNEAAEQKHFMCKAAHK